MSLEDQTAQPTFEELGLVEPLTRALADIGYEVPTLIQVKTIPPLLAGRDVIGQAPTGTGKTAAFALPILQKLDQNQNAVQALVLTPTRELAIQVAEACHTYSRRLQGVHVLPIYGGQSIQRQLDHLRRGVQIVVGTPGRIMDHLRRGTLDLAALKLIVLDEADEMLRMGFIDDVEWILSRAPNELQTALFSATMPDEVRRVADRYLQDPVSFSSEQRIVTVPTVDQRYIQVSEDQKLDALSQVLETMATPGQSTVVFVRTKVRAAQVAERLQARGYTAEAMQGDMSQAQRESVLRRLRLGQLELVIATDVAARGLDVERLGLVVNFDMPNDPEWYVHRIGRTARAGRSGSAVLFVSPREQRLLREIEHYIGQRIERVPMPTQEDVAARRIELFKVQILRSAGEDDLGIYLSFVRELAEESGRDMAEIAAGAARLARGSKPLRAATEARRAAGGRTDDGMVRLFIDAGRKAGIRPNDIVGAIANEAGVPGQAIGSIDIYDRFAFVEVPVEYQAQVLASMSNTTLRGQEVTVKVAVPRQEPGAAEETRGPGAPRGKFPRPGKRPMQQQGRGTWRR